MTRQLPLFRFLCAVPLFCFALSAVLITTVDLQAETKKELFLNGDVSNFFRYRIIPEGKAGETIDRYIDVMADAGVTTFLCNTNARRTNYRSDVWDAYWDGYDPDGPNNQPFLAAMHPANIKRYRNDVNNMLAVHRQGVDYPARVAQHCRRRGISPWITLRMNDRHYSNIPDHPFHGNFWKKNPHLGRKNCPGHYATCLDYAEPQVRAFFMALITESLDRYDIDGLELDFMREPYYFSKDKETQGAVIMTQWIRQVRKKIDAAAAKRGHPINLGVRVPSHPETASKMGLKAVAWAKEGLIDVVVATPRWATLEFDVPIKEWRRQLGNSKTKLLVGLEVHYRPYPHGKSSMVTPEIATGAATTALSSGADAVYLFNYFPIGHPNWKPDVYRKTLSAMASLDSLLKQPRRVGVTYRDTTAPGEKYRPPLPKTGTEIVFPFSLGTVSETSGPCELLIGLAGSKASSTSAPTVTVNGKTCEVLSDDKSKNTERRISFSVPRKALKSDGTQEIRISARGADKLTLTRLEMSLGCAAKD